MALFDGFFVRISVLTGELVAIDHLKLIFTLLATYPIASIYKNLLPPDNQNLKHLLSILFAILVFFGVFDLADAFYTILFDSLLTYGIMYNVKNEWGPRLVFLCMLGHMSVSNLRSSSNNSRDCAHHINRQLNHLSYDKFDLTSSQMVLVIKLTSFAFNVYDGRRPLHVLSSDQKRKSIPSMPPILEFLGYVYFFGGVFTGPAFEFMEYRRFVNMEMYRIDEIDTNKPKELILQNPINAPANRKVDKQFIWEKNDEKHSRPPKYFIPDGFSPAMGKLLSSLFWIVCLISFGGKYSYDWTLGEEYKSISFLKRLWFIQMVALCARFKYYIVWMLAEGACILSGLGFNGYDERGRAKWDRVSNIDVVAYEKADNIKSLLEAWNKNTNKWLKNYVYLRVTPPGKKPTFFSTFATFGTSAIWHGFYPGYYLTFASGAFIQSLHRTIRRHVRPIFLTPRFARFKPLYDFLNWIITQSIINYLVISFNLLELGSSLYVWSSLYFCGHVAILFAYIAFWFGAGKICKRIVSIGGGVPDGKKEDDIAKIKREGYKRWEERKKELTEKKKPIIAETGFPLTEVE
ncbi:12032_t:CDS:2 [Acaulospora morrowiae]|uniref:12032_t:CDS:1 n=1 Tax=Acaulospora morrowiae TaxID=94023 RepID=A0A9N8WAW3_9GLOM|nr:12032_t:CDS:2 [Acaulospora morrowiae]